MNKYGQYCPTARAAEILGDRWTILIVRDLLCGASHFNALERGLPGIPKAILADRLKRLERCAIIQRQSAERGRKTTYLLTQAGKDLYPVIEAMTQWAARWAFDEPDESELDPVLLMWWMHDRIYRDRLPNQQVVVEFDFYEARPRRFWLVLKPDDVSVCISHPGFDTDLLVTAELSAFYQVWIGRIAFPDALHSRRIVLDGMPALVTNFSSWLALSPIAHIVRAEVLKTTIA